jgi:hypothetical protein
VSRAALDLESLFRELAAEVGAHFELSAGSEFKRGEVAFATAIGNVVEVRLDPDVAEAAERTPSTTASRRGGGWVRFAPPELDSMAIDRARAWFLSAWRNAGAAG